MEVVSDNLAAFERLLTERFGYPRLRPGQSEILAALARSDVLAVLPTSSGKSMSYVLPALAGGRVLVVSPHIALMQDQVEGLRANGVRAAFINSNLTVEEKRATFVQFRDGRLDLLYTSPEALANEKFVAGLGRSGLKLLAIDEAHCVSEWGHTFRPDYLRLDSIRRALGSPRTVALTATAPPRARDDVARRLGLADAARVVHSVDRPNLALSVVSSRDNEARRDWLVAFARERLDQSGIVYASSRARTEELAALLAESGARAGHYHAGMERRARARVQRQFMTDDVRLIVATNAFGLGVDKPDVRFVVHYDMPARLEAYYQEAGRAGRDGEPAECVLLYTRRSAVGPRRFIDIDHPGTDELRTAWRGLLSEASAAGDIPVDALNGRPGSVMAVRAFQESGLVDGTATSLLSRSPEAPIRSAIVERHREHELEMLDRMVGYAQALGCRRTYILRYFGEDPAEDCGRCDNCRAPVANGDDLLNRIVKLRADIARETHTDPEKVFEDRTAREIAVARPADESALLQVWGIGPVRSRRYGARIIASVRAWEAENPGAAPAARRVGRAATSAPASAAPSPAERPLFEALRDWRKVRADRDGVPAFVVFSDRTLAALARERPGTVDELFTVFGIGAAKRERYGREVLEVIAGFARHVAGSRGGAQAVVHPGATEHPRG